uniref:Uncharacterized protein n=1 Tax=Arundo donax TaxID=35708 RepID=A0A0A9HT58_ARUDO
MTMMTCALYGSSVCLLQNERKSVQWKALSEWKGNWLHGD